MSVCLRQGNPFCSLLPLSLTVLALDVRVCPSDRILYGNQCILLQWVCPAKNVGTRKPWLPVKVVLGLEPSALHILDKSSTS